MNDEFRSQREFTIAELMTRNDMVLETRDDFENLFEEEDHIFGFSGKSNISNEEMLKYLNIDDDDVQDDNDENVDSVKITPCGISFEKQKLNMTDISDGKVFKCIKRQGVGDMVPSDAMVSIHYMGYFEYQDEPFDSSYLRQTSHRVRLNQGSLIEGLEVGIRTMRKHEIAHFIIHPDYAYGVMGCPPRVPGNEEVMFSVCLIDFVDNAAADTYENLTKEERQSLSIAFPKAMAFHATANDDFARNRIKQAVKGYRKVICILEDIRLENEQEQQQQQKALSKALVNLGICHNKLKEPRKACSVCLSVPLPNAKSHFTHGKALMSMGEYDGAMEEFHKAKMLEPQNPSIVQEIKKLNDRMKQYKINEKQLWSRCLNVKTQGMEMSEYAKCARKICDDFINNPDLLRQPLPPGLTEHELNCFKEQAALLGLSFTTHQRFNNSIFYLSKPNYENPNYEKQRRV